MSAAQSTGWSIDQSGCSSGEQLAPARHREGADHADGASPSRWSIHCEAARLRRRRGRAAGSRSRRPRSCARGSRRPRNRPCARGDLAHHALVGLVGEVGALGDQAVEAGSFEALEPVARHRLVAVSGVSGPAVLSPSSACSSAVRRAANGSPVRSSSPSASRSKAMKLAGVPPASSITRLAAGWMRCWSRSRARPRRRPRSRRRSRNASADCAGRPRPRREVARHRPLLAAAISTSSPSRNTIERKPSHFGS